MSEWVKPKWQDKQQTNWCCLDAGLVTAAWYKENILTLSSFNVVIWSNHLFCENWQHALWEQHNKDDAHSTVSQWNCTYFCTFISWTFLYKKKPSFRLLLQRFNGNDRPLKCPVIDEKEICNVTEILHFLYLIFTHQLQYANYYQMNEVFSFFPWHFLTFKENKSF